MAVTKVSAQDLIIWDFSITEQNHVARYGHYGSNFYKQFLPYGLEVSDQHPPQRVLPRQYDFAQRLYSHTHVTLG